MAKGVPCPGSDRLHEGTCWAWSRLVQRLVELAPQFGYRYLAIESANANASAFAERLGFSPRDNGRHWIGAVDDVQKALNS